MGAKVESKFWTLNSSKVLVRTYLPTNTPQPNKQTWQILKYNESCCVQTPKYDLKNKNEKKKKTHAPVKISPIK